MSNVVTRILSEVRSNFQTAFKDLRVGKKFWIRVGLLLVPTIVAAVAVSSFTARLTVQVNVDKPLYIEVVDNKANELSGEKASENLMDQLRRRLTEELAILSAEKPLSAKDLSKDVSTRMGFSLVATNVKIAVTNTGWLSSTVNYVDMMLVEEVDGKRRSIMYSPNSAAKCRVGQGETVEIDGSKGRQFATMDEDCVITDYDLVQVAERKVKGVSPDGTKSRDVQRLTQAYLRLAARGDAARLEHLLRIADINMRCRLMIVVRVFDVYGRNGVGEAEIFDTLTFPAHPGEQVR